MDSAWPFGPASSLDRQNEAERGDPADRSVVSPVVPSPSDEHHGVLSSRDTMTTTHLSCRSYPVPLRRLKLNLKKGREIANLVHFVFRNGDKAGRGCGNRIGVGVSTTRTSTTTNSVFYDGVSTTSPSPSRRDLMEPNKPNRIILLGVHLCGSLSLRAADLINRNPDCVEFACIKPCCLPGRQHLLQEMLYKVGSHEFTAEELYYGGSSRRESSGFTRNTCRLVNRGPEGVSMIHALEQKRLGRKAISRQRKLARRAAKRTGAVPILEEGEVVAPLLELSQSSERVRSRPSATAGAVAGESSADCWAEHVEDDTTDDGRSSTVDHDERGVTPYSPALTVSTPVPPEEPKKPPAGVPLRTGQHLRFDSWCRQVSRCISVSSPDATLSLERIVVQREHFLNVFVFVERRRRRSGNAPLSPTPTNNDGLVWVARDNDKCFPPWAEHEGGGFRNQLLFPRCMGKKKGREEVVEGGGVFSGCFESDCVQL